MLEDANQAETTTETPAAAPASQPAQGGDTPVATPSEGAGSAPQEQGVQQQSPMIPKWRFDQINEQLKQERLYRLQQQQPESNHTPAEPQAPRQEDFSTYEEYIRADARFVAESAGRQAYQQERQREQQSRMQQAEQARTYSAESNWEQKSQEAATKYPDFEQKISTAPKLNPIAQAVLKASPVAGDLAYHLAGNPELIARLNGMHPLDQATEMGRIEGKLQGSSGQPPQRKPSAGIPAITPVGAGNKQANVDPYALDTSVEDYVRATRPPPRRR
jgi:hypothetical protein